MNAEAPSTMPVEEDRAPDPNDGQPAELIEDQDHGVAGAEGVTSEDPEGTSDDVGDPRPRPGYDSPGVQADMTAAIAEDPYRTAAAQNRQAARISRAAQEDRSSPVSEADERAWADNQYAQREADRFGASGPDSYNIEPRVFESDARDFDRKADRVGSWARILDEHPVSREWKVRNNVKPERKITPELLIGVEDKTEKDEEERNRWQSAPSRFEEITRRDMAEGPNVNYMSALGREMFDVFGRNSTQYKRFREMTASDTTTVGDLKEFYRTSCREQAEALDMLIQRNRAMLEDIRTGQAGS